MRAFVYVCVYSRVNLRFKPYRDLCTSQFIRFLCLSFIPVQSFFVTSSCFMFRTAWYLQCFIRFNQSTHPGHILQSFCETPSYWTSLLYTWHPLFPKIVWKTVLLDNLIFYATTILDLTDSILIKIILWNIKFLHHMPLLVCLVHVLILTFDKERLSKYLVSHRCNEWHYKI